MISWSTAQFLLVFLGPWLLPRALQTYRSIRSRPASSIQTLPPRTSYALWLLFASALTAFISTFPIFAEENIYRLTQSRLQTPANVLMTRLSSIRALTPQDERLRSVLETGGLEASLLYARYGGRVLRDCTFATPGHADAGNMYLLYAVPGLLFPHITHLFILGAVTSAWFSGRQISRWRTIAIISGIVLALSELYFISSYDDTPNQRSTRLNDIDFVYQKTRVWRGLAIATVDGLLGWVMWLQGTGRAFVSPPTQSEQLHSLGYSLETTLMRARGLGVIRNGTMRSADMRSRANEYWIKDAEVMRDVFEEPDVLAAQRNALSRLDITKISREADSFLDPLMANIAMNRQAAQRQQ